MSNGKATRSSQVAFVFTHAFSKKWSGAEVICPKPCTISFYRFALIAASVAL